MTSALLDRTVARTLGRNGIATASLQQRQDLAAVIHLCGSGAGNAYAPAGSGSDAASDAATTTPAATWRRSTR